MALRPDVWIPCRGAGPALPESKRVDRRRFRSLSKRSGHLATNAEHLLLRALSTIAPVAAAPLWITTVVPHPHVVGDCELHRTFLRPHRPEQLPPDCATERLTGRHQGQRQRRAGLAETWASARRQRHWWDRVRLQITSGGMPALVRWMISLADRLKFVFRRRPDLARRSATVQRWRPSFR